MDFSILSVARMGPSDLAKVLGVNRVTVSQWVNGHSEPHSMISDRVQATLDDVRQAVSAGKLPVPYTVSRRMRGHYIKTALGLADPA